MPENWFDLTGKTALVTGCSRGIGRAITVALASAGADIIGVSRQLNADSDVAREVADHGRNFTAIAADLSKREEVYAVAGEGSQVDILVNNAGAVIREDTVNYGDNDWDFVMEMNLTSHFILTREIGKSMLTRGYGKIVFIASLATFQSSTRVVAYAASKAGVGGLIRAFSNEWAGRGIRVNGIAPGWIETDMSRAVQQDAVRNEHILARIPAGRWGTPLDLAGPTIFLASPASDYVSGEILVVDGGWLAR